MTTENVDGDGDSDHPAEVCVPHEDVRSHYVVVPHNADPPADVCVPHQDDWPHHVVVPHKADHPADVCSTSCGCTSARRTFS